MLIHQAYLPHTDGAVIAESDKTERVEGNHYFPPDSVKTEYLKACRICHLHLAMLCSMAPSNRCF